MTFALVDHNSNQSLSEKFSEQSNDQLSAHSSVINTANESAVCLLCTRYVFRKQEAGADGLGKRCRSFSVPDDSPSGKRTRAGGDDDALLKSVAQLEHSNQVCFVKDGCALTVVMPVCCFESWHPCQCALIVLLLAHHVRQH